MSEQATASHSDVRGSAANEMSEQATASHSDVRGSAANEMSEQALILIPVQKQKQLQNLKALWLLLWLGDRDSNPDCRIQSAMSYH